MTVWWDVIKLKQHPVAYTTTPRNKPNRNAHTCPTKDMYENVHRSTIYSYPSEDGMLAPIRYGGGGLVTQSCPTLVTPWTVAHQVPLSMGFPQQNTGMGCLSLHQGIFLSQGSNPHLLNCRWVLYCWTTREAPSIRYIHLLIPRTCEHDLIWEESLCRCN